MTVGVLLLAAGRSVRFGNDKRLALLPDGKTVLETTLTAIVESGLPCLVCLDADDGAAAEICSRGGVTFVVCKNAAQGMGNTLAEGMKHLPRWHGVLVALADMPFIQAATFRQLGAAVSSKTICRPQCGGRPGHPVAFGEAYFSQLEELSGDVGAREILSRYAQQLSFVACCDQGVLEDIDSPADLPT